MESLGLSDHIIETIDSESFGVALSEAIAIQFKGAGFEVADIGCHISIGHRFGRQLAIECACIYIEDEVLWVKALASRWWLYDTKDNQGFKEFWAVVDKLKRSAFSSFVQTGKFHEGTVGDLPAPQYRDEEFLEAFNSGALKEYFGTPADYLTISQSEESDRPQTGES